MGAPAAPGLSLSRRSRPRADPKCPCPEPMSTPRQGGRQPREPALGCAEPPLQCGLATQAKRSSATRPTGPSASRPTRRWQKPASPPRRPGGCWPDQPRPMPNAEARTATTPRQHRRPRQRPEHGSAASLRAHRDRVSASPGGTSIRAGARSRPSTSQARARSHGTASTRGAAPALPPKHPPSSPRQLRRGRRRPRSSVPARAGIQRPRRNDSPLGLVPMATRQSGRRRPVHTSPRSAPHRPCPAERRSGSA